MTSLQRQAVLVCVVCALAALLTVGITLTLLKRGKPETPGTPADSVPMDTTGDGESTDLANHYQIDNTSSALLTETVDAGTEYLDSTLFLGDSNTVRLYNNGLISLQQFCAKEGIGTQVALNEGIVTFKNDTTHYTIAQAVAKMKPRRVVMTFGTNDTGMEGADFISNYTALVQAIQEAYPYTDIIVNTVPPIPENHSNYPHMDQAKIDDFNMALLNMCEQLGVKFLNTAEVLKGENGYGQPDYYTDGDIHLKSAGLKAALSYLRTHAYQTEDRRPDTNNIPTRTLEYVSNPSSAVQAPSSEESASSSESESVSSSETASVKFEARYQVEKSGGTLSCGNESGKTSLTYGITDASQSLTVTATPAEGHVFVKWSDGVTSKTRTDTGFKQNLDVTAVFAAVSVHISEGKASAGSYVFKAALEGKYAKSENLHWFANGQEVKEAAGQTTVTVSASAITSGSYKIYAVVVYNDCAVVSNALTITINPEHASGSSSGSSSASSGSTSSSSSESGKSESTSSSSSHSTAESESKSESKSESTSSSHSSSESKAESTSSSSSTASESKTESKEQTNSESVSASVENDIEPAEGASASTEAEASR
jgi:lysophospholipase L1-like esterase